MITHQFSAKFEPLVCSGFRRRSSRARFARNRCQARWACRRRRRRWSGDRFRRNLRTRSGDELDPNLTSKSGYKAGEIILSWNLNWSDTSFFVQDLSILIEGVMNGTGPLRKLHHSKYETLSTFVLVSLFRVNSRLYQLDQMHLPTRMSNGHLKPTQRIQKDQSCDFIGCLKIKSPLGFKLGSSDYRASRIAPCRWTFITFGQTVR